MINIGKGIISGLIASALLSGVLYLTSLTGLSQNADPIYAATGVMLSPAGLSWVIHFALGALVWGLLFALLSPALPDPFWFKGLTFGAGVWLLTVLLVWAAEPTAGLQVSPVSAGLNLLFGLLLGFSYGALLDESERRTSSGRATSQPS